MALAADHLLAIAPLLRQDGRSTALRRYGRRLCWKGRNIALLWRRFGYWDGFAEIAERYEGFDLTMLEIGAFHPLWAAIHLGPDGAARAFEAMGGNERSGLLMPIHWGLFNLALHAWRQPIRRLTEIASEKGWKLWSPRPGAPTEVNRGQELTSGWYSE